MNKGPERSFDSYSGIKALTLASSLVGLSACSTEAAKNDKVEVASQPVKSKPFPSNDVTPLAKPAESQAYTGEFKFQPHPAPYLKLNPEATCSIDDEFRALVVEKRFALVVTDCRGQLQRGGDTFLKSTIPNHRVNGVMVAELDAALELENDHQGLPQIAQRTFVFHREDGKDGLPGGNLVDFTPVAQTHVPAQTSHSFSSIPLEGDNGADFGALATEMCQTKMLAEKDPIKAESVCNSFGLAVRCIYDGFPYSKYTSLAGASKMILTDGTELTPEPIELATYTKLEDVFKDRPDILVEKKG